MDESKIVVVIFKNSRIFFSSSNIPMHFACDISMKLQKNYNKTFYTSEGRVSFMVEL
jgi:hypothetical protein